jgi:hypothetical protein
MPRMMFDFRCPQGHVEEAFADTAERERICAVCGEPSSRVVGGARPALDPISGDFPSATAAWDKNRRSHMEKEQKYKREHGTYLPGQKGSPKI